MQFAMDLVTIRDEHAVNQEKSLRERLSERLEPLHKDSHDKSFAIRLTGDEREWTVRAEGTGFHLKEDGPLVYEAISKCCAEYILDTMEAGLIRSIITKEFFYRANNEIEAIESYVARLFSSPETSHRDVREKRLQKIETAFKSYLEEHTLLHLNGFVRFRLQEYWLDLRETVEYAIDEYIMDQQYQEFISLLKYFVYIQDAKIPEAHLIHQGDHEFMMLNEQMKPIETENMDQFVVELIDKDVNYEDLIVSRLITVSPERVYIHTRSPNEPVVRTIQSIFEDRAKVCAFCSHCKPILGDAGGPEQLSLDLP